MKLVVLDGYLVGTGGLDWSPLSDFGEFVYYDLTTGADDVAERIGDASSVILPLLSQAYVPQHKDAALRVFAIADHILKNTKLFHLYVNMDASAAEVAYRAIVEGERMGDIL